MPRPKVSEELRRRIAKACLHCQATKHKCDGLSPCGPCAKKGRSPTCMYSSHSRSYGAHRRRRIKHIGHEDTPSFSSSGRPGTAETPSSTADVAIPASTSEGGDATPSEPSSSSTPRIEIAIPKLSQTIYDTKGRSVYLGDCAALSFLQHIQELIESDGGLFSATADVSSVTAMDEWQPDQADFVMAGRAGNLPYLEELVHVFFASTCGVLDIFDRQCISNLLERLAKSTTSIESGSRAVIFLVLAFAALSRSATAQDEQCARYYYHHGRQISLLQLTDEPSLESVQAFTLISFYMLARSQRNAAHLNLGIAISAAKCLGMHRDEIVADRGDHHNAHKYLRTRIWRTLRYHDLHFCAMMGRTPLTLTIDSAAVEPESDPCATYSDFGQEIALIESARAFAIMQRTVTEIYTKQSVSLGLLQQLARELQEASSNVHCELRSLSPANSLNQQCILRNAVVACNYYFSMVVLSRPFLIASLQAKISQTRAMLQRSIQKTSEYQRGSRLHDDIKQGAMTAIDSAIYTIQLIHELLVASMLFSNMPLVVAWVFVAALTVCSAYFGQLGNSKDAERAIQQADEILTHFGKHSRQGRRYGIILKKLSKAAVGYLQAVNQKERSSRNITMPELFRLNRPSAAKQAPQIGGILLNPPARQSAAGPSKSPAEEPGFSSGTETYQPSVRWSQSTGTGTPNATSVTPSTPWQVPEHEVCSPASSKHSESLLDLALSFNQMINTPEQGDFVLEGDPRDTFLELDNARDIWDLNWGSTLL